MVESDYVFLRGSAVDIENAGEHDYEFVSGKSLSDTGLSNTVFVSGTGLGGVGWDVYYHDNDGSPYDNDGFDAQVGTNPRFEIKHDGSANDNTFGIIRRREDLGVTGAFDITFLGVEATRNGADNNRSVGVFNGSAGTRPFDNPDVKSMYISHQEETGGGSAEMTFQTADGSGSGKLDEDGSNPIPSYPIDLRLVYDGSQVEFYFDGNLKKTLNAPSSDTWYPAISLEDDTTVSDSERLTVDDFRNDS